MYIVSYFDFGHLVSYMVAALLIAVFVLLFYNRLYVFREQQVDHECRSQNARLALVLQTGRLKLWIYDMTSRHYITLSETGGEGDDYNPIDFARQYDRDDFEVLRSAVFDICENRRISSKVSMRSAPDADGRQRYYEVAVSVVTRNKQGQARRLLGIQRDVTEEHANREHVRQLLMRYHTVFNSSLIDMAYYNKDGVLTDINDKACQSFNMPDREAVLAGKYRLQDNPLFNALDIEHMGNTRTTAIVDFDSYVKETGLKPMSNAQGKIYYESTVNPIRNRHGELEGIYMAGRNITEMVESFHQQQLGITRLQKATKSIEEYVRNINYALRVSDARLVSYYPDKYILEISDNVNNTQMQLSQLRCIRLATPRFRRAVSSVLNRMDHHSRYNIEQTIESEIRDEQGRQIWFLFSMVPMIGADGKVERYFGTCRNMTDMVETEQKLAVETRKAQETELLKQSFLTNMSYEIRTPLNTVVGFAELFEAEHDPADEPVFVEQIKRNSNSLLLLINDILFLSRLDANMIEYSKAPVDFALIFESHCQMGWSNIRPDVKTIVGNPYNHLIVDIDQANLGKVIEKLCYNAANSTQKGTIHAKYEYRRGELIINIEDSGVGIDAETLPHVFDRFVRNKDQKLYGTGLDLPIVQALVQQMGGTIEIESEQGKGTTVWLSVPCELISADRKREIV